MDNDFRDLFKDWDPEKEPSRPGSEFTSELENRKPRALNEKEVKVAGIFARPAIGPFEAQTFVVLQDNQGRKVRIFIGRFEAAGVAHGIEGEETDRPMTYDLMALMLEKLGATVNRVIIDDIWQETFYAKIVLERKKDTFEIDCRPSDALNVAVRARCPIYMAEAVLESAQTEL